MGKHSLSLRVNHLNPMRGGTIVAAGISFTLTPGEALTVRGENGTGKTSALRAIAGFSPPTENAVEFLNNGTTQDADEIRATAIHWLGGSDGIADRLTVQENISFWYALCGGSDAAPSAVLATLGLGGLATRPAGKLSTGQRRRLGLARLLISSRPLWLLDEPLSGLDDEGRTLILNAIADHRTNGGIALMTTHEDGLPNAPTLRLAQVVAA